jgi:hypothetical protein
MIDALEIVLFLAAFAAVVCVMRLCGFGPELRHPDEAEE